MDRSLFILIYLVEYSIHGSVLEEWYLVLVAKEPEFDEMVVLRVDFGRNIVFDKLPGVKPDLERFKDLDFSLRCETTSDGPSEMTI